VKDEEDLVVAVAVDEDVVVEVAVDAEEQLEVAEEVTRMSGFLLPSSDVLSRRD